jgi:hypothetical protein
MRQMAWFERVIAGSPVSSHPDGLKSKPRPPTYTGTAAPPISKVPVPEDVAPATERPGAKNTPRPRGPVTIEGGDTTTQDGSTEARVAALHARAITASPRIAIAPATGDDAVDWGEEVPTLVKGTPEQLAALQQVFRGGKPFDPKAIPADARAPQRPPPPPEPQARRGSLPTAVEGLPQGRKDPEEQDDPTAPIGDLLRKVRAQTALRSTPAPPGQIAPNDPAVPPPPVSGRTGGTARPPAPAAEGAGEERLRTEAERLSIEAMRLVEETKAAYARAERKAALAKATSDAAAMAAEALRMAPSAGVGEALRKLEIALAMERTARANEAAAPQASTPSAMPKPAHGAFAPPPMPGAPALPSGPSMSPAIPAPPPIPSSPPVPSMAAAAARGATPPPGSTVRMAPGAFSPDGRVPMGDAAYRMAERQGLAAPAPAPAPAEPGDQDLFATQLRPKVFGLPRPVAMGVVGLVVLLLALIIGLASC